MTLVPPALTRDAHDHTPDDAMVRRHDAVLDALPAQVALLDRDGVIVATNTAWNAFAASNAYSGNDFGVGTNYLDVCRQAFDACSEEAQRVADAIEAVLGGAHAQLSVDYPCHSPTQRRWFRMTATPLHGGVSNGALVMHTDITDVAMLEEVLRDNERRFLELFRQHPLPMYITDVESLRFLSVNDAAVAQYGLTQEEFARMSLADLRPAHEVARLHDFLPNHSAELRTVGLWQHQRRDGQPLTVDVSSHRMQFNGRTAMLTLAVDVTDRLAAERELRESADAQSRLTGALKLEQERLVAAQSVAKVGSWDFNATSMKGTWSAETYRIYGQPPRDDVLSFSDMLSWIHPDERDGAALAIRTSMASAATFGERRHRIITPDGQIKFVDEHWRIERNASGTATRVHGTVQDITEREKILDALQLSEQRFRLVVEAAHVAIWDWDLRSGHVWWNDGFEAVFGQRDAVREGVHDWWTAGLHPDDSERVVGTLNDALRDGAMDWSCDYRFRRADAAYAFVRDHAHIVRNEAGHPLRMIGGATDLTAQQTAETRLREQAALLDAAHDAILLKDLDDRIVYWNKGAERSFGWTAHEAIGRIAADLFCVDKKAYAIGFAALKEHGQWEGDLIKRTRDGRDRNVEVRWTIVRGDQGEARAVLAITLDVTERKRLESQFLRAQRLESIGTLAGGIAHDLNNVLAPIMMSIELLRIGQRDPETLETLSTIEAAAQRGADMVKQVLTFARGVDGERHPVDPSRIVRDVVKIARETFPKDVSVRMRSMPSLWMVPADSTQLHQVIMNLAVNARDAMPSGGTLEMTLANTTLDETYAAMHPDTKPGPHVSITVVDSGVGIPTEVQDRLFEPFFTTKEQGKGTGLGLSTVHTIVRTHGGSVTVYSEPGKGARFVVLLPAVAGSSSASDIKHNELQLPRGNGELILVVDDEESIRTIVDKTLSRFGYEVLLASNGAEAVARYVEHRGRVAAVVTDMAMPVMDGPAMVVALHAIDPHALIIGSSGMLSHESQAHLVSAGVSHFVAKPYTAEALLTTLARILAE